MSNEHYATPDSSFDNSQRENDALLAPLVDTKLWVRICSIMGFISTGLIVFVALGMMVGFSALSSMSQEPGMEMMGAGFGIGMGIFYLLFALLMFFPSLFLHRYANAIGRANLSRSAADVAVALAHQKSFWKFVGILTLIYMTIFGVVMLIGIVGGIIGASS